MRMQEGHWHESIRTLSGHILEQYGEVRKGSGNQQYIGQ
jgi:hypothetical protein